VRLIDTELDHIELGYRSDGLSTPRLAGRAEPTNQQQDEQAQRDAAWLASRIHEREAVEDSEWVSVPGRLTRHAQFVIEAGNETRPKYDGLSDSPHSFGRFDAGRIEVSQMEHERSALVSIEIAASP
jgi:hypothetical protein